MIETKVLTAAVGVQQGDIIDKTETAVLPAATNGVIVGNFKRGRTDRPFKVTYDNYIGLLGRDINNPSYLVVEDAFNSGISEIWIQRVGASKAET